MAGITLGTSRWKRPHPETMPTARKAAGLYMTGTMSKHDMIAAGFDEALMLDWRGQVAIDGALHTPTPDCFLDGRTRHTVTALARRRRITVIERAIRPAEMARRARCSSPAAPSR